MDTYAQQFDRSIVLIMSVFWKRFLISFTVKLQVSLSVCFLTTVLSFLGPKHYYYQHHLCKPAHSLMSNIINSSLISMTLLTPFIFWSFYLGNFILTLSKVYLKWHRLKKPFLILWIPKDIVTIFSVSLETSFLPLILLTIFSSLITNAFSKKIESKFER